MVRGVTPGYGGLQKNGKNSRTSNFLDKTIRLIYKQQVIIQIRPNRRKERREAAIRRWAELVFSGVRF